MRLRDFLLGRARSRRPDGPPPVRPRLEQLEDRSLPDAATAAYVNKRFLALFNRPPDAATAAQVQTTLDVGKVSKTNVVLALENGPEFRTQEVQNLFRLLLNREADPATLNRFTTFLAQGGT